MSSLITLPRRDESVDAPFTAGRRLVRAGVSILTLLLLPLLVLVALATPALAQRVAFINPGLTGEAFWTSSAQAMQAAAKDLGVTLEVHWAERQFPKALAIARELADRPPATLPEAVIIVNEAGAGAELLRILAPRTKVFVAYSGINRSEEIATVGQPRQQFPRWIGTLEPRAEEAGYLVARRLIERAREAGRDVLFGGINTSPEAMAAVRDGRLSALSGGHFILGAWALVLVHDHLRGADFAATEGVTIEASMFTSFTPVQAEVFTRRFGHDDYSGVNFRRFSRVHQPALGRRDFGFGQLLQ